MSIWGVLGIMWVIGLYALSAVGFYQLGEAFMPRRSNGVRALVSALWPFYLAFYLVAAGTLSLLTPWEDG